MKVRDDLVGVPIDANPAVGTIRYLIIPAYNEETQLKEVLNRVFQAGLDLETVVVDDGSIDATARIAVSSRVRVVRHPFNMGYGAALQTGYKLAYRSGAELVVQMDADGQHDPTDIAALIDPIERDEADLVIGSRFLAGSSYRMDFTRSLGRTVLQRISKLFGMAVTDPTSGFQALNRKTLRLFLTDSFPTDYPDLDVLLAAHRGGIRIREEPVSMVPAGRPSTMHTGFAPVYYLYRMVLSIWAGAFSAERSWRDQEQPLERTVNRDEYWPD